MHDPRRELLARNSPSQASLVGHEIVPGHFPLSSQGASGLRFGEDELGPEDGLAFSSRQPSASLPKSRTWWANSSTPSCSKHDAGRWTVVKG
jgi:hypothetical protein